MTTNPCEKEHYRVFLRDGIHRCEFCGATKQDRPDAQWRKVCAECGKEVDRLYGLFVPHKCAECLNAVRAEQIRLGQVCRMCRNPYCDCCC